MPDQKEYLSESMSSHKYPHFSRMCDIKFSFNNLKNSIDECSKTP